MPDSPADELTEAELLRETIRLTSLGVSAGESEDVFRELVKHIAAALNVDHAFIGVLEPGKTNEVRIIAGYFFREFQDEFTYPLTNTPCENVIGQQFRYYPENVQQLFSDPHIKELETQGYAGIPLYDSNRNVLGLMAVANREPLQDRNLTESLLKIFSVRTAIELERRNADKARSEKETELHKSEDRIRATIEAAIDSIIVMDGDGKIIEFNPAAEQCFGYNKFDILGKSMAELIIPERYREQHNYGMAHFRKTGEGRFLKKRVEVTAMRADGSEFPAELAIDVAQGIDGEIFIGYIRDISERCEAENQRRQLEIQLQQAQKMEAIGQLTGGIAHDFNNILTAMMGYIALAEEHEKVREDEKLSKYLERSHQSGRRASDLIQQMLTFSRGQHGEPRQVKLPLLISEWINLLETTLPSSIEIKTELGSAAVTTMIDPVQVEQILMNLCINARDAMQGQGSLTIRLNQDVYDNCVCASCHQPVNGEFIEISVSDTGSGIPVKTRQRMFEPFYSTKEVGRGSGMGLSMVHGIVHEHDGHIVVDSMADHGSTLRILLKPVEQKSAAGEVLSTDRSVDTEKLHGRVMLIDDEPAVREFMRDLLENWGLSVTDFSNGVDACKSLSNDIDQFDLVVLDQTMPRMSGMDTARQMLALRPDFPVILYTGYSADVTETQAEELGIRALVKKPVDTGNLYRLIKELLIQH
jgi:PAS domain S-box-containing protein